MENKIVHLGIERMKRKFLPEVIDGFKKLIQDGVFEPDDEEVLKIISESQAAIEDLKKGETEKAIQILEWDLKRKIAWKESFVDNQGDPERSKKAQEEIDAVEKFIKELE